MSLPRTMKKQRESSLVLTKTMKKQRRKPSLVEYLPRDLVVEILASVAASSLSDLLRAKLVCKEFCEAARDEYVFKKASVENITAMRWRTPSGQADFFMQQCLACGNSDALFRQGMMEFFTRAQMQSGIDLLKQASNSGHVDAAYVLGIILLSSEIEASRMEGVKMLERIENRQKGELCICRARSKKVLREMWITNVIPQHKSVCKNLECGDGGRRGFSDPSQWSSGTHDDDWRKELKFCSESCKWYHQLYLFRNDLLGIY